MDPAPHQHRLQQVRVWLRQRQDDALGDIGSQTRARLDTLVTRTSEQPDLVFVTDFEKPKAAASCYSQRSLQSPAS